jgi:hypothetical protein
LPLTANLVTVNENTIRDAHTKPSRKIPGEISQFAVHADPGEQSQSQSVVLLNNAQSVKEIGAKLSRTAVPRKNKSGTLPNSGWILLEMKLANSRNVKSVAPTGSLTIDRPSHLKNIA